MLGHYHAKNRALKKNKYIYIEESEVQLLECKETISRNMFYDLFVILRTLLPLNVIHLMITNLCLKPRAHTSKGKVKFLQAE